MQSWLAHRVIAYVMGQTRKGNIGPTLALDGPDVTLTFPGDNSWSGTYRGRSEVEPWLRRFADVGLQTFPDEVVLKGFPWNATVCVRGHDHLHAPTGELVYENRFVIWGHMRWGRLRDYEVYEDTIKPRALDAYLERIGALSGAPSSG